ncbi:MAG TPA: hypothetical protein VEY30_06000 [Myxococcaceae bacterium]|nr:hypothetical protein [Myxococcaceae bacterium]
MADIKEARRVLITRILEGSGSSSHAQRRAAFDGVGPDGPDGPVGILLQKVARHAAEVTDQDFDASRARGLSEDQVFELVVCAAIGQAARLHDEALQALEAVPEER